jgi:hypothetical protein
MTLSTDNYLVGTQPSLEKEVLENYQKASRATMEEVLLPDIDKYRYFIGYSEKSKGPSLVRVPVETRGLLGPAEIALIDWSLRPEDFWMVCSVTDVKPKEKTK